MRVYRVEGPHGNGPYCGDVKIRFDAYPHRPGHAADGLPGLGFHAALGEDVVHGFESIVALYAWFDTDWECREMAQCGYLVFVYEVQASAVVKVPQAAVRKGRKQLIFDRAEADLAETFSIEYDADEAEEVA